MPEEKKAAPAPAQAPPLGKKKKGPQELAEYFYDLRKLHIQAFIWSLATLLSFAWMIYADWDREWKRYQRAFQRLDRAVLDLRIRELDRRLDEREAERAALAAERDELAGRVASRRIERDFHGADVAWTLLATSAPREHGSVAAWASAPGFEVPAWIALGEGELRVAVRPHDASGAWLGVAFEGTFVRAPAPRLEWDAVADAAGYVVALTTAAGKPVALIGGVFEHARSGGEIEERRGEYERLERESKFANGEYDSARTHLEKARREYEEAQDPGNPRSARADFYERALREAEERFNAMLAKKRAANLAFEEIDSFVTARQDAIFQIEAQTGLAKKEADLTAMTAEIERLRGVLEREKPQWANYLRNAPVLDFFGPQTKIEQEVLPRIQEDVHFARVEKVDRCWTCHMGINNPRYETFVEGGERHFRDPVLRKIAEPEWNPGETDADARARLEDPLVVEFLAGGEAREIREDYFATDGDREKHTLLFSSHPYLDRYLMDDSAHPMRQFGCTICHEGDGRETNFARAVHTPRDEEQEADWKRRSDWSHREQWEFPMIPMPLIYSSCRRCHSEEWALDGATPYNEGMLLFERLGCHGCHKTDAYPVLDKDVPRLSNGQIDESRRRRRPGPPLLNISDKLTREWAFRWILRPREFRPSTRMPHFFGQLNRRRIVGLSAAGDDTHAYDGCELEDTQVAATVEYLWLISRSEPEAYRDVELGDAERGRDLFFIAGCTACHGQVTTRDGRAALMTRRDYEPARGGPPSRLLSESEFAPALGDLGSKLDNPVGRRWLYRWLREPHAYFPNTSMPRLSIADAEARDLMAFLLGHRDEEFDRAARAMPPPEREILRRLAFDTLSKRLTTAESLRRIAVLESEDGGAGLARWVGALTVETYGCYGCHEMSDRNRWRVLPEGVAAPMASAHGPDRNRWPVEWTADGISRAIREAGGGPPDDLRLDLSQDWTNTEGIGTELTGPQPWASKFLDQLDFGDTHFDGENYFGIVDWEPTGCDHPEHALEPVTAKVHVRREEFLRWKLREPRIYDAGRVYDPVTRQGKPPDEMLRMPSFGLNDHEIERLATFVFSFTNHEVTGLVDRAKRVLDADEAALQRGERILRDFNCRACHVTSVGEVRVQRRVRDPVTGVTTPAVGWIEAAYRGAASEAEADAFRADVRAGRGFPWEDPPPGPYLKMDWVADRRTLQPPSGMGFTNGEGQLDIRTWFPHGELFHDAPGSPYRRYSPVRPPEGGWAHARLLSAILDRGLPESQGKALLPPFLRTQGHKTDPLWLYGFLRQPYPIRPSLAESKIVLIHEEEDPEDCPPCRLLARLRSGRPTPHVYDEEEDWYGRDELEVPQVRMGTFPLTHEEIESLVRFFRTRDEAPSLSPSRRVTEEWLDANWPQVEATLRIVVDRTSGCRNCHAMFGRMPGGETYRAGPDLAEVYERFQPQWLEHWFRGPLPTGTRFGGPMLIYPGTVMLDVRSVAAQAEALGATPDERGEQLVEYLVPVIRNMDHPRVREAARRLLEEREGAQNPP